jgi:hypothetical protein
VYSGQHGDVLSECVCTPQPQLAHSPPSHYAPPPPTGVPHITRRAVKMKWPIKCHSLLRQIQNADVFPFRRQGFGRGNTKSNQNLKAAYNGAAPSPTSQQPPMPPLANSPSVSSTYSQEVAYNDQEPKKFLQEKYAKCSVKGNFLTLAAQPKNVELGEWLAHQRKSTLLMLNASTNNLQWSR